MTVVTGRHTQINPQGHKNSVNNRMKAALTGNKYIIYGEGTKRKSVLVRKNLKRGDLH